MRAVGGLDLAVEAGEIFGFLGPNGAGKTTTVRLLNGILAPTAGRSAILGLPSADEAVRRQTATLAELAAMYGHLSALRTCSSTPASTAWRRRRPARAPRSLLARVLLHRPRVIFLDEPTSGLDPQAARQVTRLIRGLALESGTTIFLCTHNLPLAEGVCDTFGFIREGRLVAGGSRER